MKIQQNSFVEGKVKNSQPSTYCKYSQLHHQPMPKKRRLQRKTIIF